MLSKTDENNLLYFPLFAKIAEQCVQYVLHMDVPSSFVPSLRTPIPACI